MWCICLTYTQVICDEISNNQPALVTLEEDGGSLSQGVRTRESAKVKSRLNGMRRRWESLCSQAADSQAELSSHAGHWQQYQDAEQRVLPWLDHAERVLAEECGKTACQEDAQEQYDAHQVRKVEEIHQVKWS